MPDDFLICEHCVADNELRAELAERGTALVECLICKSKGGRALPASDTRLKRTFRALVRLNFSEWDYNPHIGGDPSLESLIIDSKTIFNLGPDASIGDFEDAYLVMEDGFYPDTSEEIRLGGAYWDGWVLDGLRDKPHGSVDELVHVSLRQNYFDVLSKVKDLVESIRADITSIFPSGTEMVRARIGVKSRLREDPSQQRVPQYHYLPFSGEGIDRPPLVQATEGRLNRHRVSVLYLASDAPTAVAELRPHPGHLVSTARFRARTDLSVANFASHDIRNFLSDERLEVLRCILSIADVLNLPVQPDQQALYIVTQLFADSIREAGFDAVSFKSSLGMGTNLTCFKNGVFEMVPNSERAQEVTGLQYRIAELPTAPQEFDNERFKEDSDDPLSTLLHGMARRWPRV